MIGKCQLYSILHNPPFLLHEAPFTTLSFLASTLPSYQPCRLLRFAATSILCIFTASFEIPVGLRLGHIPRHWACPYEMIGYDTGFPEWFNVLYFVDLVIGERHHCIYWFPFFFSSLHLIFLSIYTHQDLCNSLDSEVGGASPNPMMYSPVSCRGRFASENLRIRILSAPRDGAKGLQSGHRTSPPPIPQST